MYSGSGVIGVVFLGVKSPTPRQNDWRWVDPDMPCMANLY